MTMRSRNRIVDFEVLADHLVRTVTLDDGRTYTQRCTRDVYEQVAHAMDELADDGATEHEIARKLDLPFTQVSVALTFMLERGCVIKRFRRSSPASRVTFEDAMTEYHALREKPSEFAPGESALGGEEA